MTNDHDPNKPIHVNDPMQFGWAELARQAAQWCHANPKVNAVLVFDPVTQGLDLTTRDRFMEFTGRLVLQGDQPFKEATVLQELFLTLKVTEAKIQASPV